MRIATAVERRRSSKVRRAGFTLVEIVITVLIMGILTAVAAPKFADTLHRTRAESAAKRIKVDLGLARQNAISRSLTQTVKFTPATDDYTLPGMADLNHSSQTYSVDLAAAPYNAVLVSANLGGDSDVQFDHYGQPDSCGTITVESGAFPTPVIVHPDTGQASIP